MGHADPRGDDEYAYAVRRTHLYLRLSLVGTILAIFLAVALTPKDLLPNGQGALPSISHYYYSPARIVFVGALCAAALALLTLAGRGLQSYLLDIAALLAPLIALIPTPVKLNQVGAFDPQCERPDAECIPRADFEYVRLGFRVWLILSLVIIVVGFVRAIRQRRRAGAMVPRAHWVTLWVAAGIWCVSFVTGTWFQAAFHSTAHFAAAGAFFLLVSWVVWIEAVRQWRRRPGSAADRSAERHSAWRYILAYGLIGTVLAGDILAGLIVIVIQGKMNPGFAPTGVFVVEAIGLVSFAAFFAVETYDHRNDGEAWELLPPSRKRQSGRVRRDRGPAASTPS